MPEPIRPRHASPRPSARALALVLIAVALFAASPAATAQTRKTKTRSPKTPPARAAKRAAAALYSCPMHPDMTSKAPGATCPKCGMNLVKSEPAAAEPAGPAAAQAATPGAAEALRIPETSVLDQDGRRLDFYKDLVKGRTVAINFIFTTCTTVCPPLTANFRRVQQLLGERAGREVSLISVSVDPTTDTPERLKAFAEKFKAGPGWTFVTGGKPEMDALLRALGAATADKNDHTPTVLIGNDAAGHWTRTYGLSPASALVKVIEEAAAHKAQAAAPLRPRGDQPGPGR